MSDTAPRPGTTAGSPESGLRQLGLDSAVPLPAWVILNAVRNQAFSGEVTLHTMPAVRVWACEGTVYWAERAGATPVADRLVELGAITPAHVAQGAVRLGDTIHLGRLFERVPNLDHDEIVNAIGFVRDSLTAEVADLVTDRIDVVPGRQHASGIVFWFDAAPPARTEPHQAPHQAPHPEPVADSLTDPPDDVVSAVRLALDEIRATLGIGAASTEPDDPARMDTVRRDDETAAHVASITAGSRPTDGLRRLIGDRRG